MRTKNTKFTGRPPRERLASMEQDNETTLVLPSGSYWILTYQNRPAQLKTFATDKGEFDCRYPRHIFNNIEIGNRHVQGLNKRHNCNDFALLQIL